MSWQFPLVVCSGGVVESAAHRRHRGSASVRGLLWEHGGLGEIRIQSYFWKHPRPVVGLGPAVWLADERLLGGP